MAVADHQLDPAQAPYVEAAQEFDPDGSASKVLTFRPIVLSLNDLARR